MKISPYIIWSYSWPYLNPIKAEVVIDNSFKLNGSEYEWNTINSIEFADDQQNKLYISGVVNKGITTAAIFGYVDL